MMDASVDLDETCSGKERCDSLCQGLSANKRRMRLRELGENIIRMVEGALQDAAKVSRQSVLHSPLTSLCEGYACAHDTTHAALAVESESSHMSGHSQCDNSLLAVRAGDGRINDETRKSRSNDGVDETRDHDAKQDASQMLLSSARAPACSDFGHEPSRHKDTMSKLQRLLADVARVESSAGLAFDKFMQRHTTISPAPPCESDDELHTSPLPQSCVHRLVSETYLCTNISRQRGRLGGIVRVDESNNPSQNSRNAPTRHPRITHAQSPCGWIYAASQEINDANELHSPSGPVEVAHTPAVDAVRIRPAYALPSVQARATGPHEELVQGEGTMNEGSITNYAAGWGVSSAALLHTQCCVHPVLLPLLDDPSSAEKEHPSGITNTSRASTVSNDTNEAVEGDKCRASSAATAAADVIGTRQDSQALDARHASDAGCTTQRVVSVASCASGKERSAENGSATGGPRVSASGRLKTSLVTPMNMSAIRRSSTSLSLSGLSTTPTSRSTVTLASSSMSPITTRCCRRASVMASKTNEPVRCDGGGASTSRYMRMNVFSRGSDGRALSINTSSVNKK